MAKTKGSVRSSQLVTTYGIGSIVALADESFMIVGLDRWPISDPDLFEPRLERILNVRGFVRPPASDDGNDVPVVRFPRYHTCPECHRLEDHKFFGGSWLEATCADCDGPIIPARFVMACERGHIDDFPWFRWVHADAERQEGQKHRLKVRAGGVTSALGDVIVSCSCGRERSLDGAFNKSALKGVTRCTGKRPWLGSADDEVCDETPRALQRGASNVWFSVMRSAISIPPWSEGAFKALDQHWKVLRHLPDSGTIKGVIEGMGLPNRTGIQADHLVEAVLRRKRQEAGDEPVGDVKAQEHEALIRGRGATAEVRQDFVCEAIDKLPIEVDSVFKHVSNVTRLREVRVLEGFTRLLPPEPGNKTRTVPVVDAAKGLLPAIEVIGEGVFFEFQPDRIAGWEARPYVLARVAAITRRYNDRCKHFGVTPSADTSPRKILVHTFAHALLNQWAFDSGYPASSLRERLYVGPKQAGFLIYTASSDSGGSLGGVISQTTAKRLLPGLQNAVHAAAWCSADPLCIEAESQGADALNLGACHACVLLPETSCEEMNLFLDRGLMVGTPEEPELGFFADWVSAWHV